MSGYRAVLLVLFVVGGSLTAAPAVATDDATAVGERTQPTAQTDVTAQNQAAGERAGATESGIQQSEAENETVNGSLGSDISSFMQSNAAEANGAVETGMWDASFNATENRSNRKRLVERRTDELRAELTELQERKEELMAEREDGNISNAAYKARLGQLVGRINALKSSINATEPRAEQVDTNVEAIRTLETETNDLGGPEIAELARNTSGLGNATGPPGNATGPPGNATGPPGNGNGPPGNGTPLQNASNASDDAVADSANGTPGGRPDGVGNATDDRADSADDGVREATNDTTERRQGDEREPSGVTDSANRSDDAPVDPANRTDNGSADPANQSTGDPVPNASTPSAADELGYGTLATATSVSALGLLRAPPVA
ncbi:hypothetical protein NGM10_11100 [Halorussus salilacus]|uniref:DUF7096 domain-containing protein n=1 Tax=Halorussus salilacus TaxID=2953750 RepID=UPI0020A20A06|nr:hypothetical protein [Halorussus salilacus]USZ67276.1 hypothetical protein NGM10_11100 [Halorussus salilacus]